MEKDIRLLEDLVLRAVERLKRLTEERDQLREQLRSLRQLHESGSPEPPDDGDWQVEKAQVVSVLRETLSELRGG